MFVQIIDCSMYNLCSTSILSIRQRSLRYPTDRLVDAGATEASSHRHAEETHDTSNVSTEAEISSYRSERFGVRWLQDLHCIAYAAPCSELHATPPAIAKPTDVDEGCRIDEEIHREAFEMAHAGFHRFRYGRQARTNP